MRVIKFGGTSVGSAERYAAVADIIAQVRAEDPELVVVVSAMSGTTNGLIGGARAAAAGQDERYCTIKAELLAKHLQAVQALLPPGPERIDVVGYIEDRLHDYERLCRSIASLGEFTMRGNDAVASIGEELSVRILAALLRSRGLRAQAVSATALICTDEHYGEARPNVEASRQLTRDRLLPLLSEGTLPIVTGYIGATARGVTTTLGRGGSDYSAAILGACLDADEVGIWTDVDGILTADPKLVPTARTLRELSYREAAELAYFGADVLHPKTIAPLASRAIPLRILNSYAPERPGTRIVSTPSLEREEALAILSSEGLSLVGISTDGFDQRLDMAARAIHALAEAGVDVLMFSQSFCERSLNLVVRVQDETHSIRILERAFERETLAGKSMAIGAQQQVATLSVVGLACAEGTPVAPRALAALGQLGLRVVAVAQSAAGNSVSFVIPESDVARAVPYMHRELGLALGQVSLSSQL